jgi:hypothetical protein
MKECEFFLAVNDEGEWDVSQDKDSVCDNLPSGPTRIIRFLVLLAPPVTETAKLTVPDAPVAEHAITVTELPE